jgi:hypothetical protein
MSEILTDPSGFAVLRKDLRQKIEEIQEDIDELSNARDDLEGFLIDRESDIAWDIEDLGELKGVFALVFGRKPEKDA